MSGTAAPFQLPPDEDHKTQLQTIWWTTLAIASVFMGLRFWARTYKRYLGWDDAFMVGSWLCFIADAILINYIAETGRTRHLLYLGSLPAIDEAVKYFIIVLDVGIFVTGLGKIAIGITILRIIGDTSRWQKWVVYFVIFLTISSSLVDFCISTFRCGAPENTWTIEAWATVSCISEDVHLSFNTFANSVQVFADFTFSVLPMAIVWQMRLPLRQKIWVVVALGLTLVTGTAGTIKAVYAATMDTSDLTWNIYPSLTWFAIEAMLIIVCGTIPSLHALYQLLTARIQETYGSKESKTVSYSTGQDMSHPSGGDKTFISATHSSRGTLNDAEAQFDAELARLTGSPVQTPTKPPSTAHRDFDVESGRAQGSRGSHD